MKIISVNIGAAREIEWQGEKILTGIFKQPTSEPLKVSFLNIKGDEQADPRVHGGKDKAVYSYDVSYYAHWKNVLDRNDWSYGMFGENLTTEGLPDTEVRIGNIYRIGSVLLQAVEPRFPCFKLNARFGLSNMTKLFWEQKRNGTYFRVLEEGFIEKVYSIRLVEESKYDVTIENMVDAYQTRGADKCLLKKILEIEGLPERTHENFLSLAD